MERYNNKHYTDVMTALIEDEFEGLIHDEIDNDKTDKINELREDIRFDEIKDNFRAK